MVIYEVNLEIQNEIYDDYMDWLKHHIKLMLRFNGFISAKIAYLSDGKKDIKQVTVWYTLETRGDLEQYFALHASAMRQDGVEKFGNKFSANRRIFEPVESISI